MFKKIISFLISFCFLFEQIGFAQIAGQLDISARMSSLIGSIVYENYRPIHLRYLSYDQLNNDFKLLLDKGSAKENKPEVLEKTAGELLKYFFVGITLPSDNFWVNLRPDSPQQIINDDLAKTDMGKIMLEADVQLKKDTAKYTSPETLEGREYWDKLYKRAEDLYASQNVTIPTLTRPWIVPDEIIVKEAQGSAYIYKATLKVMLEQDYLKGNANYSFPDERSKLLNEYSSQIIKETIIPKLTREINSSKRYAPLRQVYYSLILAQWFKDKYKNDLGKQTRLTGKIDTQDLTNLTSKTKWDKDAYFNAYQKSFKDGEYNIKETTQGAYGQTIRNYFAGGMTFALLSSLIAAGKIPGKDMGTMPKFCYSAVVSEGGQIEIKQPELGTSSTENPTDGTKSTNNPVAAPVAQSQKDGGTGLFDRALITLREYSQNRRIPVEALSDFKELRQALRTALAKSGKNQGEIEKLVYRTSEDILTAHKEQLLPFSLSETTERLTKIISALQENDLLPYADGYAFWGYWWFMFEKINGQMAPLAEEILNALSLANNPEKLGEFKEVLKNNAGLAPSEKKVLVSSIFENPDLVNTAILADPVVAKRFLSIMKSCHEICSLSGNKIIQEAEVLNQAKKAFIALAIADMQVAGGKQSGLTRKLELFLSAGVELGKGKETSLDYSGKMSLEDTDALLRALNNVDSGALRKSMMAVLRDALHEKSAERLVKAFNPGLLSYIAKTQEISNSLDDPSALIEAVISGAINDIIVKHAGSHKDFINDLWALAKERRRANDFQVSRLAITIIGQLYIKSGSRDELLPQAIKQAAIDIKQGRLNSALLEHQVANYFTLLRDLNSDVANGLFGFMRKELKPSVADFGDFLSEQEALIKGNKQNGDVEKYSTQIKGLVCEADYMYAAILQAWEKAKEMGRDFYVVANLSYGGVALAPITEDREGGTFIVGTDIPVWFTKVGSTESHNNEQVLLKDLFSEAQIGAFLKERPMLVVVDGSTSVASKLRSAAHIPDGFKGYRNYLIALNQAIFGKVDPREFQVDAEFVSSLLSTPEAQDLLKKFNKKIEASKKIEPGVSQKYPFGFWYIRNKSEKKDEEKSDHLYLRVGKKIGVLAEKMDIGALKDHPAWIFFQSAIHPEDIGPIAQEFIGQKKHTAAFFDDQEHFKRFGFAYDEKQGLIVSNAFIKAARKTFWDLQAHKSLSGSAQKDGGLSREYLRELLRTQLESEEGRKGIVREINQLKQEKLAQHLGELALVGLGTYFAVYGLVMPVLTHMALFTGLGFIALGIIFWNFNRKGGFNPRAKPLFNELYGHYHTQLGMSDLDFLQEFLSVLERDIENKYYEQPKFSPGTQGKVKERYDKLLENLAWSYRHKGEEKENELIKKFIVVLDRAKTEQRFGDSVSSGRERSAQRQKALDTLFNIILSDRLSLSEKTDLERIILGLRSLCKNDLQVFDRLITKCRQNDYKFPSTDKDILKKVGLADSNGNIYPSVTNIIKSKLEGYQPAASLDTSGQVNLPGAVKTEFSKLFTLINTNPDRIHDLSLLMGQLEVEKMRDEEKAFLVEFNQMKDPSAAELMAFFSSQKEKITLSAGQIAVIFYALKNLKNGSAFQEMIEVYNNSENQYFKDSPVIRELLAVALHKTNNLTGSDEAIKKLMDENLGNGEVYAIRGKIHKLRYEEAKNKNDIDAAKKELQASIDSLEKGFLLDFEFYPGINLVYNLITQAIEDHAPEQIKKAERIARMVYDATLKAGGLTSNDYWTVATMLESAILSWQGDEDAVWASKIVRSIEQIIPLAAQKASVSWEIDSTLQNLKKIRSQIETEMKDFVYAQRKAKLVDLAINVFENKLEILKLQEELKKATSDIEQKQASLVQAEAKLKDLLAGLKNRIAEFNPAETAQNPAIARTPNAALKDILKSGFNFGEIKSNFLGGNIKYKGQLHDQIVTRWDVAVAREILNELGLKESATFGEFNTKIDIFLREVFNTDNLEDLDSIEHKEFNQFMKNLLEVMSANAENSRTNIMVDLWLRQGDCRQHAYIKQLLFDVWKTDSINQLLRDSYQGLEIGNTAMFDKKAQDIRKMQNMQMLVFDSLIKANIQMNGMYNKIRNSLGNLVFSEKLENVEEHTWNGLVILDENQDVSEFRMVDAFYQKKEYAFGGQAGKKIDLNDISVETKIDADKKESTTLKVASEKIKAARPDSKELIDADVFLESTFYAGDRNKRVVANNQECDEVMLRGVPITAGFGKFTSREAAGFFNRKAKNAIEEFVGMVRSGERKEAVIKSIAELREQGAAEDKLVDNVLSRLAISDTPLNRQAIQTLASSQADGGESVLSEQQLQEEIAKTKSELVRLEGLINDLGRASFRDQESFRREAEKLKLEEERDKQQKRFKELTLQLEKIQVLKKYAAMTAEEFADPIILDAAGGILKVGALFHGTNRPFKDFIITNGVEDAESDRTLGEGVYFVDNNIQGAQYANVRTEKREIGSPRVVIARLIRNNLLDCRNGLPEDISEELLSILDKSPSPGWNQEQLLLKKKVYLNQQKKLKLPVQLRNDEDIQLANTRGFQEALISRGYDGLIYTEGGEHSGNDKVGKHNSIVVFDPGNIITWEAVEEFKNTQTQQGKLADANARAEETSLTAQKDGGNGDQKQFLWTFRDTHRTNDDLRWRTFSNREELPSNQQEGYYKAYFNPQAESFDDAVILAKIILARLKWSAFFKHIEETGEDVDKIASQDGRDKKHNSDYSKIVFYARTAEQLLDLVVVFKECLSKAPVEIKSYPGGLSNTLKINDLLQVGFGSRELYQQAETRVIAENEKLVKTFAQAGIMLQEKNQPVIMSRQVGGDSLAKNFAREFGKTIRIQAKGVSWEFQVDQDKVNWQGFNVEGKEESELRGEFSMGEFRDIALRNDSFAIKVEKKESKMVFYIQNITFPDGVTIEWDSAQKDGGGLDAAFFKTKIAEIEGLLGKIADFDLKALASVPGCEMIYILPKYLGAENNKPGSKTLNTIWSLVADAENQEKVGQLVELNPITFAGEVKLTMDDLANDADVRIQDVEFQVDGQSAQPQQVTLKTYPVILELIIREYVLNAIKKSYSAEEIAAGRNKQDLKQIRIVVNLLSKENKVQVKVIDQGVGMDEETQKNVFTSSSKPQKDLRAIFQSTGLGLSFIRDFSVDILQGEAYALSAGLDKGSEFGLTLPLLNTKPLADKYVEPIAKAIRHDIRNNLTPAYMLLNAMEDSELQTYQASHPEAAEAITALRQMRDITVDMYKETLQIDDSLIAIWSRLKDVQTAKFEEIIMNAKQGEIRSVNNLEIEKNIPGQEKIAIGLKFNHEEKKIDIDVNGLKGTAPMRYTRGQSLLQLGDISLFKKPGFKKGGEAVYDSTLSYANLQTLLQGALGDDYEYFKYFALETGFWVVYDTQTQQYEFWEQPVNHFLSFDVNDAGQMYIHYGISPDKTLSLGRYIKVAEGHLHPDDEMISWADILAMLTRAEREGKATPEIIVTVKDKESNDIVVDDRTGQPRKNQQIVRTKYAFDYKDLKEIKGILNDLLIKNKGNVPPEILKEKIVDKYFLISGMESPYGQEGKADGGNKQTTLDQFDAKDMIDRLEVIPLTGKMQLISQTGEALAIIESRKGRLKNALRIDFNGYDPQFIIDNKVNLLEQTLKIAALVDIRHLALAGGEAYNRDFTKDVLKISAEENIRTILSGNIVFISGRRLDVDRKGELVLQKDGGKPRGPGIGEWLNPARGRIYLNNAAKSIDMIRSGKIMQPEVLPPSLPQKTLTPAEQEEYDKEYNELVQMQAEIFAAQAAKEIGFVYRDGGNTERVVDMPGVQIVLQDGFEISSIGLKTYGTGKGVIVIIWDESNKKGALLNLTDTGFILAAVKGALSGFNVAPRTLEFCIIAGKDRDRQLTGFLLDFLKLQSPKDIKRDISENGLRNILFDPKTGKHSELKNILSRDQSLAEQKILEDSFMPGTRGHLQENKAEWKYVRPQIARKEMPDLGKMTDEDIRKIIETWELKGADWLGELSQKIEQDYNQGQSEGRKYAYFTRNEVRKIGVPADFVEAPEAESSGKNVKFLEADAYIFNAVVAKKNSFEKAIKASVLDISQGKVDSLFSFKFTIQHLPGRPHINISWDKVAISKELEGNQYGQKAVENFAKVLAKYFGGASITTEVIHDKALESFQKNFETAICTRPRLKAGSLSADNSETWRAVVPGQPLTAGNIGSLDGGIPVADREKGELGSQDPLGGVDFRGLPIVNQPGITPAGLNQLPSVNIADLDWEWQQIEKMAATDMVPSTQRLKEFLGACCSKGALDKYSDNVLACIADIMRLEEEKAQATEPALREILILLESNRPENELQQSLSFITVTAGEPQA